MGCDIIRKERGSVMKRIIDGKVYNTDTATEVAHFWNGLGGSDFRNVRESLYVTKKGNWFLCGSGGPMSKYAVSNGNTTSEGSDILPISKADAMRWLESYDETEAIEKYFQDNIEEA